MKSFYKKLRNGTFTIVAIFAIAICVATIIDNARFSRLNDRIGQIKNGITRDKVVHIMGPPDAEYSKGSGLWTKTENGGLGYGKRLDWENAFHKTPPFFFPFALRLFGPMSDDINIYFDEDGKVLRVELPKRS